MGIFDDIKELIQSYFYKTTNKYNQSKVWKEYNLGQTLTHCGICYERKNKIFEAYYNEPKLPEHINCKCYLDWLRSVEVGKATKLGVNGADFYLKYYGKLPDYYITKEEAKNLGWISKTGNLDKVAPGKMIGGNVYKNQPAYLPEKEGRFWYECDVDYNGGYRNNERIVYSNDGLMFKTDSHYTNFISIE